MIFLRQAKENLKSLLTQIFSSMNQTTPGKTHNPIQEFTPTIRVYDINDKSEQPNGVICSINSLFN